MEMGGGLPFSSGLNNDNKSVWGWLEQDIELVQTVRTSSMFFVHRQKLNLYLRFLTSVNALQLEELKLLGSMTNIAQNKICLKAKKYFSPTRNFKICFEKTPKTSQRYSHSLGGSRKPNYIYLKN